VLGVDERCIGGLRGVVPFSGCCFATGILGGGYDFEVVIVQLGVKFLPAWQI
jgi:hypothetical protein